MIPVSLKMRNFMCYRDDVPPLSFEGIHTACISGENGHGKSALIDAMTWALWGKTRAKSDDDLINQGQSEMEVEFDFTVGRQPFRIIRKRSKSRRRTASGQSSLDLLMAGDGAYKVVSGDSIAQTQQKIIDILHMDYDTFVNSAYLRQGHADEFTRQPPARRKEVLASILNLSLYDELEERAKEMAKRQETEKGQLESSIGDIALELVQKPSCEAELVEVQNELSIVDKTVKEQESKLNELRREKESLENRKSQLSQLEQRIAEKEAELGRWEGQTKQHIVRLKEYDEVISRRAAIEDGYARFTEAKKAYDELNQKLGILVKLNERKSKLELAVERAKNELLAQHRVREKQIEELEAKSGKLTQYRTELQVVNFQWQQLSGQEEDLQRRKQEGQELQATVSYLESSKVRLEQELREIKEKLELLQAQGEAKCPLCETELGAEGKEKIEARYTAESQSKAAALKTTESEINQNRTELKAFLTAIARLEDRLNQERVSIRSKEALIRREIDEAEKAHARLEEERKGLTDIEQYLASRNYALPEHSALGELENELVKLDYRQERHEQMRQQLTDLEQYESQKRKLDEADRSVVREKEALAKVEEFAQQSRLSLQSDRQKKEELGKELDSLPQLAGRLEQAEGEYQMLSARLRVTQQRLGGVQAKLARCVELEARMKEKEKLLGEVGREAEIYKALAGAFGKKGVQAWLIEQALPEIEIEANKLLSRMTDNRMHVKIETQRETKKGDVVETLEIDTSDELGTRKYEMFSGGEAFRINFAIRIALSKLLARRAGAPLPTLIIDEGFGTQDNAGIEKLKEAVNSIQGDFDKILVITHIDELKDAFPARIDVVKTPHGSTISVS